MIAGDDSRLPFSALVSARFYTEIGRGAALFGILAVAISVALAVALEMSTRSVREQLDDTAERITGAASWELSGVGKGVPEAVLDDLAGVTGVTAAAPLIEWTVKIGGESEAAGLGLHVLGVDLLADRKVRDYEISDGRAKVPDPLRLLSRLDSIIVAQALLDRTGLGIDDALPIETPDGARSLYIRGVLLPGGVADAFAGQVAIMDVYSLQELLDRRGWFERVGIVLERGADAAEARARIEEAVAGRATVRRPSARSEYAESMFNTLGLAITLIAIVGAIVAAFLTYSIMSRSVDQRREEFAILQVVGLEPLRVRRIIAVDAALRASAGTALGLVGGAALSRLFLGPMSTIFDMVTRTRMEDVAPSGTTLALALGVGMVVTLAGAVEPALRATSRPPLEILRRALPASPLRTRPSLVGLVLVAALAALWFRPDLVPGIWGLGLVFALGLLLVVTVLAPASLAGLPAITRVMDRVLPGIGSFTGAFLRARPAHTALTLAAIAGIVGGFSGVMIVINSTSRSIHDWIASRYPGGVIVSAVDLFATLDPEDLDPAVVGAIRSSPGVRLSAASFVNEITFRGRDVVMFAREIDVMREVGSIPAVRMSPERLADALLEGHAAVSEGFARTFGLGPGDTLTLQAQGGPVRFEIAGLVRDYATAAGTIHLHRGTFLEHWPPEGRAAVVIWPSARLEETIAQIRAAVREVAPEQVLFFTRQSEYAKFAERTLARFVGLLYGVAALASLLGGVALINLIGGAIADRRRELALLQTSGATRVQLGVLATVDVLTIASIGIALGFALGLVGSESMFAILRETMGWTVERHVDAVPLLALGGITLIAAALTSLIPAFALSRFRPSEALLVE